MGAEPLAVHEADLDHLDDGVETGPELLDSRELRAQERKLLARYFDGLAVFLAGPANVVLQLSWPEVGYGVVESKVYSGQVFRHPLKRYRTTIGYLAIAMFGSDDLRMAYREAVNRSHRPVRSGPDSPVKYNAFNRDLQLWVASCICYGARDAMVRAHGPMSPEEEEILLRASSRFATTLQVPEEMWHDDVAAFWEYWEAGLNRVNIDQTVGGYLRALVDFKFFPKPLRPLMRPFAWANIGFLPAEIRAQLGYDWSDRDERRHARLVRLIAIANRPFPPIIRQAPVRAMMWNIQLRRLLGRPLV
jgi:uncharacterized protein (DUF2236 family)